MLVIPQDGSLRLIFQADHATLSGRIASDWREEFIAHRDRREEILEAVAHHDSGWAEADLRGVLNGKTARPASFLELPDEAYPSLWLRSIEKALRRGPLAGYLVASHFAAMAGPAGSEREEAMEAFRVSTQRTIARLAGLINPPQEPGPYPLAEGPLENDLRFLQINDLLSLVVLGGHVEPSLPDYLRASAVGGELFKAELGEPFVLRLAPWVFRRSRVEGSVRVRTIADRDYPSQKSLSSAIARADAADQPVRIEPL